MAEEMNMGEVVMVVDDNKEIVYSISELLKYEGYRVIPAYDGMEALNLLEQNPVDLILLDVMMPRLNGLSALMKLREKYRIPVIILSAKTEESDKVSGLVLGADDYVEKPYNPAELMARVKAHLRRYRACPWLTPPIGTQSPAISIWVNGRRRSRQRSGWQHRGCGRLPGRRRCVPCPSLRTRTCGSFCWSRNPSGASGRLPSLMTGT